MAISGFNAPLVHPADTFWVEARSGLGGGVRAVLVYPLGFIIIGRTPSHRVLRDQDPWFHLLHLHAILTCHLPA